MDVEALRRKAAETRLRIFEAVVAARKGHIGGALSCVDILVSLYHGGVLRVDPRRPVWNGRDRFILSKGHAAIAQYAVLSDLGFFDTAALRTVCHGGSFLGEHPDRRVPGVEADTGSLGHGLGIGAGLALAARMDKRDVITVVLLGDGECYEGTVWEAFMFAAHHRLNRLAAVIDRNRQITLDYTEDCLRLEPLADKIRAFGWEVVEVDGHSFDQLHGAFSGLRARTDARPLAVIADTVKGKGVSFMEGKLQWHHGMPDADQVRTARRELEAAVSG